MPPRASIRVRVLVMQKRADYSSCQEETLLINNEYMTIGQAKAKPYWFALCLTDVQEIQQAMQKNKTGRPLMGMHLG